MSGPTKYVYVVSHPDSNEVVYVGCSKNVELRGRQHALDNSGVLYKFINDLLKEGKYPVITVVEKFDGYGYTEAESRWILKYYNMGCKLLNRKIPGVKKAGKQYFTIVNNIQ